MGFYQFYIIFICNTYLILFNVLTATADDSASSSYSLTLKTPENTQCPKSLSTNTNETLQCAAADAFEKFFVECNVKSNLENEHAIVWYQGSKNRSEKDTLIESNERIQIDGTKLTIKSLDVSDARIYHCRIVKKGNERSNTQYIRQQSLEIFIKPRVPNIRKEVTGIEENPIHLNCTVTTSVPATVKWRVDNGVLKNVSFDKGYKSEKYELSGNDSALLTDVMFTIKSANITDDRGSYMCWAESEFGQTITNMTFVLRVKGKYAALWPFLGICAEVVILCVIILIYEKKRDKTELEESDTDQGPETKSSPDHVQDNVRYRK